MVLVCAVAALFTPGTRAAPAVDASAAIRAFLNEYIDAALRSNDSLREQTLAWKESLDAFDAARKRLYPTFAVNARYTVATGGRTIEVPVGDLLNPVYQTLNTLGRAQEFPQIDNQTINLQMPREQDTRLQMTVPLYAPQLSADIDSKRALAGIEAARREALARTVVRDTQQAWCAAARAQSRVSVLEATEAALAENVRVNRDLLIVGKATRDRLLRAQVEELAIRQHLSESHTGLEQAKRYLNFLVNRPLDTPVELPTENTAELAASLEIVTATATGTADFSDVLLGVPPALRLARAIQPRAALGTDKPTGTGTSAVEVASTLAMSETLGGLNVTENNGTPVIARAGTGDMHPELRQLDRAIDAAKAGVGAVRASYLPQISFAGDYGYEGDHYRIAADSDVGTASLIASWVLFDSGQNRARVAGAQLETERLITERNELLRRLTLVRREAAENVTAQRTALAVARVRFDAANENFRIAERKRNAGALSEVEFLDAERTRTEARLDLTDAYYGLLAANGEQDYALASYPLPSDFSSDAKSPPGTSE